MRARVWSEKIERKQRKRVLERDQHKCVVCWRKYALSIHHHYDFTGNIPPKNGHPSCNKPYVNPRDCDLVTLCKSCHGKIQVCNKQSPLYQFVTSYLATLAQGLEGRAERQ